MLGANSNLANNVDGYIGIEHYAGGVYYDVDNFIDKNLDQLSPDINEAMENSKNKLLEKLFKKKVRYLLI